MQCDALPQNVKTKYLSSYIFPVQIAEALFVLFLFGEDKQYFLQKILFWQKYCHKLWKQV